MTILRPQKPNTFFNIIIALLSISSAASAIAGVLLYHQSVNTRYDIAKTKRAIEAMEIENVGLRQRLSDLTDTDAAREKLQNASLVRDTNPSYLSITRTTAPALAAH